MAQVVICGRVSGSVLPVLRTSDARADLRFGGNCLSVKVLKAKSQAETSEISGDAATSGQKVERLPRRSSNSNEARCQLTFGKVGCQSRKEILSNAALSANFGGGGTSGTGIVAKRRDLRGTSLNDRRVSDRLQVSVRRRVHKMATMAMPRAVMEDSGGEYEAIGDVESQKTEYGTFGTNGDAKVVDDVPTTIPETSSAHMKWDLTTARLADSATAAFLLLQLPQIILNTQNLIAGNYAALFAIPWMGQLTGLLGNLSLLSYFASKRERGAMVVQAVGVVSTLIVLMQLAIAGAMPLPAITLTASAVVVGLIINFLNYVNKLSPAVWRIWGEVVSIAGLTVLPQVMWSTFEPYIPHSVVPGIFFGVLAVTMILLARLDKLPPKVRSIMGGVSAWTATLLFMWAPVAQWWVNYINPANIRGLSVFTILLAMVGNSLLLPRALFTRDLMWFTGSSWGTMLQGWGILLSMYMCQVITDSIFWGVSAVLALWLGSMLWNDSKAYQLNSPLKPLVELISGIRR
ncbi:hypothetical protein R1flu_023833 [Riccia fluitans]|uniref:Uncharacterized protein n=1 Tax=Riccia fluitans TaxID=41844 RepID=A0ABD1XT70_9MARC